MHVGKIFEFSSFLQFSHIPISSQIAAELDNFNLDIFETILWRALELNTHQTYTNILVHASKCIYV